MSAGLDLRLAKEFNRFGLHHEKGYFDPLVALLKGTYDLKGKNVLEFGCGTGDFLLSLADSQAESLTGVDISEVSIREAQKKRPREDGSIRFICVNILEENPFDAAPDIIISHSVLQYMTDLDRAFGKFYELLSFGGVIFMTVLQRPSLPVSLFQWFSLYALPQVLKERFYVMFRLPGFRGKFKGKSLSIEALKSKSRYLGIPVVQNREPQSLRSVLERAGFVDIAIGEAPQLSMLSSPHYLITARKQ